MRGDQSGFNGGADTFAALGISQAGGIADEQHGVVENLTLGAAEQAVSVSCDSARRGFDPAGFRQELERAGFSQVSLSRPFDIQRTREHGGGRYPVFLAVGSKA